jgi:8-oxo-dGTP diphosphatase
MPEIPNDFYRVSIKALILDETRTKFLTVREDNGWWELPGGGLDFGESIEQCIRREIKEEMGLEVTEINPAVAHYLIGKNMSDKITLNLIFETKVKDLNFVPSQECQEIKFISPDEVGTIKAWRTVTELAALFNPKNHQ